MVIRRFAAVPAIALSAAILSSGATGAQYHHVHIAAPSPSEAVRWYAEHMECEPIVERANAVMCQGIEIVFFTAASVGGSPGTGVDHIGFSFEDLEAKMQALETVGVGGGGVRLQRFEDGATFRDVPGLFRIAFVFDPWGTRIELVEDPQRLGFHHIHLSATDPAATLAWYEDVFGGERGRLAGRIDGLRFGDVWLLASEHGDGEPAPTDGRTLDHIGFVVDDLDAAAADMRESGVEFEQEPVAAGRNGIQRAFLAGPDNVRVAVVETGWVGAESEQLSADDLLSAIESYQVPRTPWSEPDLQGIWTGDAAHGIPLERPEDAEDLDSLSPEEAAARRERGTLRSIWGYEREWRDTTLGFARMAPLTQVAMIVDPPNGRLPSLTPDGEARAAAAADAARNAGRPAGPEDMGSWVRCITQGLPRLMMPGVYNNGLQIVQSPGYVAIQKEMIHETRVIPTTPQPKLGEDITQWLGVPQGHWDGDTLVVETISFNGGVPFEGSSEHMTLTERFTRIGPEVLEYRFTVDDPATWTTPWTGMFMFVRDDSQYELVEYACHEGNYGMTNILSGARAEEAAEAGAGE
jgi:catechol 2,3-dioxygenase-like lactoylglutathione lyase family enzyme